LQANAIACMDGAQRGFMLKKLFKQFYFAFIMISGTIGVLIYLDYRLPSEHAIIPRKLHKDERLILDTLYPELAEKIPDILCHYVQSVGKNQKGYKVEVIYRQNVESFDWFGYTIAYFDEHKKIYKFVTDNMETVIK
jgi:hypothetical protein